MKQQIFTVKVKTYTNKHKEKRVIGLTLTARPDPRNKSYDFRHCRLLEALAGAFSNPDGFVQMVIQDYSVRVKRIY